MQTHEIKQRFSQIERSIDHAAQGCREDKNVPQIVKEYVFLLDEQSDHARNILQSDDEKTIWQCVGDLRVLSDYVKQACDKSDSVNIQVKNALLQAYRGLAYLNTSP